MFGWAFREAMRDRPTLCIPDDHDRVPGQQSGARAARRWDTGRGTSSLGGYRSRPGWSTWSTARTLRTIRIRSIRRRSSRTSASTTATWSTATWASRSLADRQFKSGPEHVDTGSGRADHVLDPELDTAALDAPGLCPARRTAGGVSRTVGGADWRGHTMKVLLRRRPCSRASPTHHGGYDDYLIADLDCGGWPQTPREPGSSASLRKAKCLHVCGDQHLPSLVQYGAGRAARRLLGILHAAISAGYPRWWRPDEVGTPHRNRPPPRPAAHRRVPRSAGQPGLHVRHRQPGSRHRARPLRAGAPEEPAVSGWSRSTTEARTYRVEAFRFLADARQRRRRPVSRLAGHPAPGREHGRQPRRLRAPRSGDP